MMLCVDSMVPIKRIWPLHGRLKYAWQQCKVREIDISPAFNQWLNYFSPIIPDPSSFFFLYPESRLNKKHHFQGQ